MAGAGAGAEQVPPGVGEAGPLVPGDPDWRDWAGGVPGPVLAKVAGRLVAAETRGPGSTLMAITCRGWKNTLEPLVKEVAAAAAGVAPKDWRDWGNLVGEDLQGSQYSPCSTLCDVLAKVAGKILAQTEAGWAEQIRMMDIEDEDEIELEIEGRISNGNGLFVFAMVCKQWRKMQLQVGDPLGTLAVDVIKPGRVALVKWALAEGCPRQRGPHDLAGYNLACVAARYGHIQLVQWLCREQGLAKNWLLMVNAAGSGNLELVQWLHTNGCPWDIWTSFHAVRQGHVEVLRWARENGCPWSAHTRHQAAATLGYTDNFDNPEEW